MNLKIIYNKDDLRVLYEKEVLSYKWQIALNIPDVWRFLLWKVFDRLIPDDIEIEVRKAGQRRNPYFPE